MIQTISLVPFIHHNRECIGVYFTHSRLLNNMMKKVPGICWSKTNKCWYVLLNRTNYAALAAATGAHAILDTRILKQYLYKKNTLAATAAATAAPSPQKTTPPAAASPAFRLISHQNMAALAAFVQQLELKSYSPSTIRTYRNEFCQLLQTIQQTPVETLTADHLKRYMLYTVKKEGISENTAHSRLNALKFYFEQVLGREKFFWEIPRPKKRQQLPKVISEEKIITGLTGVQNLKHKTILLLAYSAGLRVSEVISLRVTDINSDRMQIAVNDSKGKKDRVVTLSPAILELLRKYYKLCKPKTWLFEGQYAGEHYSSRAAQLIFKAAYKKLGLPPQCSFHSLRHSYATHLLESGTDIAYIQKLLGHNDIKTTLRYTRVSNRDIGKIESPLDKILRKRGA